MENIYDVARYTILAYEKQTGTRYDNSELKLQKLMYLIQRESFAFTGKPMFNENFEGWKHGPVIPSLRHFFEEDYRPITNEDEIKLTENDKYIINNVISQYGMYEPWYLANLTHNEISWQKSRKGLKEGQDGNTLLKIEDIKEDAKKIRLYDHIFDMYIDEFEDYDE
ncbi:type II toxin-antitoxin system antitoxin SocA domain-containing protein [uncultured Anaerococcus sp.]|uniref:Panacea domain-containing protein n=1 Tax=uncultured Anaerococcus sp. TaxID=293428 RepID=UPI00288B34ED|nr:type II toxin-antitoxin system antitoxin SocA domain-containing protein [uncultured Anaerococcus sp.]